MDPLRDAFVLGEGRFLRLVRRAGWEYVERTRPVRSVFIAAMTDEGRLLLTVEHRIPLGRAAVGFPAGLVGDLDGEENESLETAVRRELIEEAGYEPRSVEFLSQGPTSPGMTDEVIALALATGLSKVGDGGGIAGESIAVHEVPLDEVDAWLRARVAEGALIDPKVYACLYFLGRSDR
ncbi:NUDIX hydrolase [soil metagenome]